jgi:hypothetical protein
MSWHAECFLCSLYQQPFTENCVPKDDLVLHPECYKECFGERYAKCTELITPSEAAHNRGLPFHMRCYKCVRCGDLLASGTNCLTLFQFPYCAHCSDEVIKLLPTCCTCRKAILPEQEFRSFYFHGSKSHAHVPCFRCCVCQNGLNEASARSFRHKLFCEGCYTNGMKFVCAGCNSPIFSTPITLDDRVSWHSECFKCSACNDAMTQQKGVLVFGILKCKGCAARDRTLCGGCGKPVEQGVPACGTIWHQDCLKCQKCKKSVLKISFTSVCGKPVCQGCKNSMIRDGKMDKKRHSTA